jgi:hypothetical protein
VQQIHSCPTVKGRNQIGRSETHDSDVDRLQGEKENDIKKLQRTAKMGPTKQEK